MHGKGLYDTYSKFQPLSNTFLVFVQTLSIVMWPNIQHICGGKLKTAQFFRNSAVDITCFRDSHLAWSKCSLWYVTSLSPHLWPLWSLVLKWWIVWNLLIELNFQAYKILVNVGRYAWPIFINSCRTPQGSHTIFFLVHDVMPYCKSTFRMPSQT